MQPGDLVKLTRQSIAYKKGTIGLIIEMYPSNLSGLLLYDVQLLGRYGQLGERTLRVVRSLEEDLELYKKAE
jgi:hypothetical protein